MTYKYMKPNFFDDSFIVRLPDLAIIPFDITIKEYNDFLSWVNSGNQPLEFDNNIWMGITKEEWTPDNIDNGTE